MYASEAGQEALIDEDRRQETQNNHRAFEDPVLNVNTAAEWLDVKYSTVN